MTVPEQVTTIAPLDAIVTAEYETHEFVVEPSSVTPAAFTSRIAQKQIATAAKSAVAILLNFESLLFFIVVVIYLSCVDVGAASGARTRDIELGKFTFYQLNYRRILLYSHYQSISRISIPILHVYWRIVYYAIID